MKNTRKLFIYTLLIITFLACSYVEAFALTEANVQAQVDTVGKEAVTGNIFVWFLCAVAFLKVSQKIDSFMSSLGINVGHTGGSMMAEMMIAARGISTAHSFVGRGGGGSYSGGSSSGSNASFMQGGLVGAVGRSVERGAAQSATGNGSGGIGGMAYNSSVSKGGGFANRVIGGIARGNIASSGTISGENASSALMSYLGYTAMGEGAEDVPSFSNVEIGGGRITATETSVAHPSGIAIGMYSADQYMPPEGDYTTVAAADGSSWYKQYAVDTVEKTPYKSEDGSVAYHENIQQRLPKVPPRKDRI
jgi:hypothetical protein